MRIILAALMVMGVLQQRAEACSCRPTVFVPTLIPLNARIPVLTSGDLVGASLSSVDGGTAVPFTTEPIAGGFVVVPSEPLAPDSDYAFNDSVGSVSGLIRTRFINDETPPPAPTLGAFTHFASPVFHNTCEISGGEGFTISVIDPEAAEVVYEIFTGPNAKSIDTSAPAVVLPSGAITLHDASLCGRNFPVSSRGSLAVAVRSRDFAGNVSELSNAVQLKGCSTTGGPGLLILASLLTRIWAKSRRKQAVG